VFLFYEFVNISVLADYHSVKLVMLIQWKTFERHFYLHKKIKIFHKISNLEINIQLTAECDSLAVDDSNQRFLLWKDAAIKKCRGKGNVISPADKHIYGKNVLTCESSLYFQRDEAGPLCTGGFNRRTSPQYLSDTLMPGYTASVANSK